jgi:WD40 repeat protein
MEPEDETVETPSITAQTTTTVPVPGSSRGLWQPPDGTWVGAFALSSGRPDTLFGPTLSGGLLTLDSETTVVDSLPDGRLVGVDSNNQQVVLIGVGENGTTREVAPLPMPGPQSTPPLLSPNGTRLAVIDAAGVPYVWKLATASLRPVEGDHIVVSPRDSASTAVEAIASLSWSPDSNLLALNAFQGGYYVWDLEANAVSRASTPGRAVALSNSQVAAWGIDGLEVRDLTGRVLRRWPDLRSAEDRTTLPQGAFDPLERYLAVRGRVGDDQVGLTVLSTIGTTRRLLTTEPAQGFAWSGDGSGLYWLDSNGLQVWSADPERASATMLGGNGGPFPRLRVYDPAMAPLAHPALETASLMELRDGIVTRRTINGSEVFFTGMKQATVAPAGVGGLFLTVATGEPDQPVALADPPNGDSSRVLGNLEGTQLGNEGRIVGAIPLSPGDGDNLTSGELDATRWYLETDNGSILFGPDAGLFTTVAEGRSLSYLAGIAFSVVPDGSAIQTIPDGDGTETVLTAAALDAERILAVAVVRRAMFVLLETQAGEVQILQVPADSELLATPLFPPAPSITSSAWVVYRTSGPASGGAILAEPDPGAGEVLAARIDGSDGPVTVVMAAPLALESVCGARAGGTCVLFETPGRPLGFSPDGNWLLIGNGDEYLALSTVGRGRLVLTDNAPDGVAWVTGGR